MTLMEEIEQGIIEERMFAKLIFSLHKDGVSNIKEEIETNYSTTLQRRKLRQDFEENYRKYEQWKKTGLHNP